VEAKKISRLATPIGILVLFLIPGWPVLTEYGTEAADLSQRILARVLGTGLGLAFAWLLVRLIDVFVWNLLEGKLKTPVPRLIKDVGAGLIFLVAGTTIVSLVFKQSVAGIWATSGIVGIVVGFALRNMIADVFSGVAINVDRPFNIGDWIEIHPRSVEPLRGCVTEISWRTTRIKKTDNTTVVVPNSLISSIVLINYSMPEPIGRFSLTFCLEFGVPAERALRVLLAGAKAAEGILPAPAPKVLINRVTEQGVEYKIRYWLDPTATSPRKARHRVTASILQHLHHAGLSLAYPKKDLFLTRMPNRQLDSTVDRQELLGRTTLFSQLIAEEIKTLASRIEERRFHAGAHLVEKGAEGDSMFILVEGLLNVCTNAESDGRSVFVDDLEPGDFFGEMCLLTGCPRSATIVAQTDVVVFEIGHEAINELFRTRPEISKNLAKIVAQRRQKLEAAGKTELDDHPETVESTSEHILDKMKTFFSALTQRFSLL
jgi:small-conductance mechanosensitive channel/CRP-like cAMP-binding protein